ncbi:MAG TPA: methyltransferase domain-containing protein [Terriglobales bacterium]|nr:methyltransferase domain-containing protein [Terriglobales bacterium]
MKFFRGSSNQPTESATPQKLSRRSSGVGEISRVLNSQEGLCILDVGATSANNIRYFTDNGHKNYSEDLLRSSLDPALQKQDSAGTAVVDGKKFLDENLTYPNSHFDIVLLWNLADYMEESLVKPTIDRLWSVMKPGGLLLAFFHTRDAGPDSICYRYHVSGSDVLEMQQVKFAIPGRSAEKQSPRLQRVFNNRHIENLFHDFASIKFFLARDNIREVLVVR